ncbi:MAG: ABC transporter substrate-binding protein [Alphaproteobacteria bacterium]|nr:ABC transporter substrate-binding protein [Alphaproteobacteria bacterium]
MKSLMRIFVAAVLVFFSLEVNAENQPLTKEEALAFTKQFIDDGKTLAKQHTDLTKEPSAELKKKFHDFLVTKIANSTARSILGRAILSAVADQNSYISNFISQFVGYEVKFYGSPEKMRVFQEATYDEKTAKIELSPDGKIARVEISFFYDGKTAAVQFFIIKENGALKLDDLYLEGISQKNNQTSEIRAFYSNDNMGKGNPQTFLTWFTSTINAYLER